ncbi:hypothetical protein NN561_006170 [Cricetulus griseus]
MKPMELPPGRALRFRSVVPRRSPVPRKAGSLRSPGGPASPSRKGTAGEQEAACAAEAAPSARCGAMWGKRGPPRARNRLTRGRQKKRSPLQPSKPTAHQLGD